MLEFKIPELGENVSAGDVVRLLVSPGDSIAKDQPILELETEKATIEVPSNVAGTVKDIKVKQGDKVKVGQVVLTVDDAGAAAPKGNGAGAAASKADGVPSTGSGPAPSTGSEQGPSASSGQSPSTGSGQGPSTGSGQGPSTGSGQGRQAQAATPERAAPSDAPKRQPTGAPEEGGLSQKAPGQEETAAYAEDRGGAAKARAERDRGTTDQAPEAAQPARPKRGEVVDISRGARAAAPPPAPEPPPSPDAPAAPAAPSVRRLARELGVDIRSVPGSGQDGRISTEDVQAYVRTAMSGGAAGAPAPAGGPSTGLGAGPSPLPDFSKWGEIERKPMSNIRRKTAEHLSRAWTTIPHVTQHDKADITAVEALRKQYGPQAEKAGGKLTMTAIALKIAAGALRRFPQFNSSIDVAGNAIIYKKAIHIGVAVDTERGLLVPVIRDVDRKGIIDLSVELAKAADKARAGKLSLDEMQGGGFSITNLGGIGGTAFTPIVNWPEAAILGISRGTHEPVYNGSAFEPRLMLPLSLSYDHRVIDGADAARFLRWVAEAFEQPFVLAL